VFLSSHELAEVEPVCDRVGILRAGKLVEVASVAALRRLHRTQVAATFAAHHQTFRVSTASTVCTATAPTVTTIISSEDRPVMWARPSPLPPHFGMRNL
jgi:ABC-type multidrug transport system ATPase subunit